MSIDKEKFYVILTRKDQGNPIQTLGELVLYHYGKEIYRCKTLERPWKDNKIGDSCVPVGIYPVKYHNSPKFKAILPWLQNTAPRQYILIHKGNYYYNIEGCILVGKKFADINGDGHLDVTSSGVALNEFLGHLTENGKYQDFTIEIK